MGLTVGLGLLAAIAALVSVLIYSRRKKARQQGREKVRVFACSSSSIGECAYMQVPNVIV